MKRILIIIIILVVALGIGGGIAYYYNFENSHYVQTEDAQVSADMVTVLPQINGAITDWNAKVGAKVTKDQVLGKQETDTQLSAMAATLTTPAAQQAASEQLAAKAEVKSPIDGKVIQATAIKGQMASTSTSLAVVADTDHSYITANIKEVSINDLQVGQKVDIKIDAFKGKFLTGEIENIGQATASVFSLLPTQNATGNYTKVTQLIPVKISIDGGSGLDLMPGMNASVKIHLK